MNILIIGGNRFFGRHLAKSLLDDEHQVTLLNRGKLDDGFGQKVQRLQADRKDKQSLMNAVTGKTWDLIYDQICYSATEARLACEIFKDKTQRYVVTSSESVYDTEVNALEKSFDPSVYTFEKEASPLEDYKEAKRQVEVIFTRSQFKEVVISRPSLVVGVDDYSGRLKWHIKRIQKGLPIYFPRLESRCDFIRSDQAGIAMKAIGLSKYSGAVNCTSPGSLQLSDFVKMCEKVIGKKALLANEKSDVNNSPYGWESSMTMNTDLLKSLGAHVSPSSEWMEDLIRQLSTD